MLMTLIPLFDKDMSVSAYSIFTQKKNFLLNPSFLGTGQHDGAGNILGLELIQNIGFDALSTDKDIFVTVNNISVFSDLEQQCDAPHNRLTLLMDKNITPDEMYINRIKELKDRGYKLAMRKLAVSDFEPYREILQLMDYILLDHKKINVSKAKIYFSQVYPNIKLCAGNIETQEIFEELKKEGGYELFEGEFFRVPLNKGETEVSPLKVNYIQLLNVVNGEDFELTQAADVIGRDTALVISLLKMVNRIAINSEITSIRHAAAMLGQKELKKWINTAVTNEFYADKPNEITRLSLLRARFAESLASLFDLKIQASELFLMGLFSVLDIIMEKPMEEALKVVKVSKPISDALVKKEGKFAPLYEFILHYEAADWQEVSRLMILHKIDEKEIFESYLQTLEWYRNLLYDEK